MTQQSLPRIVSPAEWRAERDKLLAREKAHTKASDALAAERRRLPMVRIEKDYTFEGVNGKSSLLELFEGRRQLIVYHFMFGPDCDDVCSGCSWYVDNICHLAHLHARDTSLVLISRAPQSKLQGFKERMGWTVPWFSSFQSDFNFDFGTTVGENESSGTSVFLRDGSTVYRTYFTTGRGDEMLGSFWAFLDLTPLGRQETWEDSPEGWPQSEPYEWWRLHDRYEASPADTGCGCH